MKSAKEIKQIIKLQFMTMAWLNINTVDSEAWNVTMHLATQILDAKEWGQIRKEICKYVELLECGATMTPDEYIKNK